ncbi:hypothetical protein ACOMHN_045439 [Nucella lapillus]
MVSQGSEVNMCQCSVCVFGVTWLRGQHLSVQCVCVVCVFGVTSFSLGASVSCTSTQWNMCQCGMPVWAHVARPNSLCLYSFTTQCKPDYFGIKVATFPHILVHRPVFFIITICGMLFSAF